MVRVDHDKCSLCRKCIDGCPYGSLEILGDTIAVNENCAMCGACEYLCPSGAISSEDTAAYPDEEPVAEGSVWVLGELLGDQLHPVVLELAGAGRRVADGLGVPLGIVMLGRDLSTVVAELSCYDIDDVICLEHRMLVDFNPQIFTSLICRQIRDRRPSVFLGGATAQGRSLLPRLAVELETGLTADCTGLEIDSGRFLQTRPAFGGNIYATIECPGRRPQMATVRPRVMAPLVPLDKKRLNQNISRPEVKLEGSFPGYEVLKSIVQMEKSIDLAEAEVIIAGGRGMKGPEGFELLNRAAGRLGAVVGASRAAVDAGWVPYTMQIGQTGRTVQPRVYIAMGISGAVQHIVGMQTSECIIAVNSDPEAPIFSFADYGMVADAADVAREIAGL